MILDKCIFRKLTDFLNEVKDPYLRIIERKYFIKSKTNNVKFGEKEKNINFHFNKFLL